ncbi:Glycoside hydrolase [Phytophthora megakarya]|uniref:Glycoside hydrolase n=1 Tax=Phytophthora megakarya TaxID=4795 RepID=A0A225WI50_9STRA|nr:Glycoside hydrolase [Phytophthora megakarya]
MSSLTLNNLFDVKGKVVVITGGGRGIGKMMADGFVQNGATVYIASRRLEACEATAQELNAKGPGKCIPLQANLLSESGCKELAERIAQHEDKVDVLVNNSGVSWGGDWDHHPEAAWTKVLTVNVTSPFHLTKFLLPLLDAAATSSDAARVINIGSVAGLRPQQIDTIAYDTSKAAIHHMTRVLAAKLARRPNGGHILVNAIAPGLVPSKMSQGISVVTGLGMDDLATGIPIERVGNDADMAGLAIFLASKASGWITGMVIASDGGQVYTMETGVGSSKL